MAQSVVTDNIEKTQTTSYYGYDAFGRRTLVQDAGFATMRTLYDGQSFDIIRENEVFGGGDFTTSYMQGSGIDFGTGETTNERYRYIEGGSTENGRYRNMDGYTTERSRFTGTKASLYAKGESVAVNRSASTSGASGRVYFGTDILGSVRSATTDSANIEERYEYDAFGTPYKGDFTTGLDGGYTGKPYDATTGLYNYGYRDYSPETARFTTVDPIRDGSNWFSYVVNDPVNYVDLWGLECSTTDAGAAATEKPADPEYVEAGIAIPVKDLIVLGALAAEGLRQAVKPLTDALADGFTDFVTANVTFPLQVRAKVKELTDAYGKNKSTGSYTATFQNNDMKYHGKGGLARAAVSAYVQGVRHGNMPTSIDWTPAPTHTDAFIDEYRRLAKGGGPESSDNYNIIQSPGREYHYKKYGFYLEDENGNYTGP